MEWYDNFYEIEALSYFYGISCAEVRSQEWTQEEIDKAIAYYDGPRHGGRPEC
jgi:hypothetical protein